MQRLTQAGILLLLLPACQAPPQPPARQGSGVFLPLTTAPPAGVTESSATASLTGRLVVAGGCVRVEDLETGEPTTVLWHHDTQLVQTRSGYSLVNRRTGVTRPIGEVVQFGGGGIRRDAVEREYAEIARRCGGPYATGWLSG